ncbi:hypothetical protein SAMN02745751_02367 [Dethiosulfatibacter aminovorans DSM 17477]|uniref:Uncharacterized protein n=1 Tax=Dethiosulfatibacter aminovorans DSM 17477 TaxID=1121476 RepID=A0A1M6IKU8_9FIRM|nr:hypothetical protein [Dethiosulfatibacter aminovorans]SHJ35007.1 hypothetical protein SAMN02745751_02367 [Dethiosulfatibacter aminovorans DSM 17477]
MTKKNIWVFHHYATPPTMNGFTRPFNFAINMKAEGYKTTVFAASYLHFSDKNLIEDGNAYTVENQSGIDFVFVNTPSSAKSILARVKNMLAYYVRLFSVTKKYIGKPELFIET